MDLTERETAVRAAAAQMATCRTAYTDAVAQVYNQRRAPEAVAFREQQYAALAAAVTALERAKRRLQRRCPDCVRRLERGDHRDWCDPHAWVADLV